MNEERLYCICRILISFFSILLCVYLCGLKPLKCHLSCRQIFSRDVIGSLVVTIALQTHFYNVLFVFRINDVNRYTLNWRNWPIIFGFGYTRWHVAIE